MRQNNQSINQNITTIRTQKAGLKMHMGKTKCMKNHADSEDILTDQEKIEKVTEFIYLG